MQLPLKKVTLALIGAFVVSGATFFLAPINARAADGLQSAHMTDAIHMQLDTIPSSFNNVYSVYWGLYPVRDRTCAGGSGGNPIFPVGHILDVGTLSSGCDIGPGTPNGDYWVAVGTSPLSSDANVVGYWKYSKSGGTYTTTSFTTRILTVIPQNNQTVSTSTAFVFATTGYVSDEDYDDGLREIEVQIKYNRHFFTNLDPFDPAVNELCQIQVLPNSSICGIFTFPINAPGSFSFSTTTSIVNTIGAYTMITRIQKPSELFGIQIGTNFLQATTTTFIVGRLTGLDQLIASTSEAYQNLLSTTTALSIQNNCNPLSGSFNAGACLIGLVVPTGQDLAGSFNSLYNGFLSNAPFGYITRFYEILSSEDLTTPPPIEYSFGSSSPPVLQAYTLNDPIYFQIWDRFDEFDSIQSDQVGHPGVWDVVMPYFSFLIYAALFLAILSDLMGIEIKRDQTQQSETESTYVSSLSRNGGPENVISGHSTIRTKRTRL